MKRIIRWFKGINEQLDHDEQTKKGEIIKEKQNKMNSNSDTDTQNNKGGAANYSDVDDVINGLKESLKKVGNDAETVTKASEDKSAKTLSWAAKEEKTAQDSLHERMDKMESKISDVFDMFKDHFSQLKAGSTGSTQSQPTHSTPRWNLIAQEVHKELDLLHKRLGTAILASDDDAHKLLAGLHTDMTSLVSDLKNHLEV